MDYFKAASEYLAMMARKQQKENQERKKIQQIRPLIQILQRFLESGYCTPIFDFSSAFSATVLGFGFLYDPLPHQPEIKPVLQASPREKSQYYCAKFDLGENIGDIFVIPQTDNSFAIVLKPSRQLRHPFVSKRVRYPGLTITHILSSEDLDSLFPPLFLSNGIFSKNLA